MFRQNGLWDGLRFLQRECRLATNPLCLAKEWLGRWNGSRRSLCDLPLHWNQAPESPCSGCAYSRWTETAEGKKGESVG